MTNQVTIELETAAGVWTDITADVLQRDPLSITRGRSDEQGQASPQRMTFTLNNRGGKYSPRNPLSPLFGKIGRNSRVRCKIDNGTYDRFFGEVPSWPPKWNESHTDNYVQVEAYGFLRRLGQGQPPVSNALRDWVLGRSTLAAYYPLSGGEETTYSQNIAPGKTGSFSGRNSPVFTYGKDMGAAWLGTGLEINATGDDRWLQGTGATGGAHAAIDFVFSSLAMGVMDVQLWPDRDSWFQVRLNTSGDAGTVQVSYYDGEDLVVTETATGVIGALQDTGLHTCRLQLSTDTGPKITYTVYVDGVQIDTGDNGLTQSLNGAPLFRFLYSRYVNQTYANIAHIAVWADNTLANLPTAQEYTDAAFAYAGETAIDRVNRVASDGGIVVGTVGVAAESMPMGPQFTDTRLAQIQECEATDMGILLEHRSSSALMYRSRTALYNQTATFTLDYGAGQIVAPLEPVDDDQSTRNDVTATRRDAGSARFTVDTGPLSTQDPPLGVGRYETDVTVNPETDGFLDGIAAWVANLGTLDKARWPQVTVNLNSPNLSPDLRNQVKSIDVGEMFTITNMDAVFVYDDVSLIVVGYSETISPFVHTITFNCMPADPYTVGAWSTSASSGTFRWDTGRTTLTSNVTATATSMSFTTAAGNALWTTDANAFPLDVAMGGERVRVTNITGASSPQTATVVRSINGVVKAQTAGTDIRLFDTPRWAL